MLRQRSDVGQALSREDEQRLLDAIRESRSPSLYPFFVLSIDAGLRPSETRALRRSNLLLECRGGAIIKGEIVVGRSKTNAGTGRMIPLTQRACAALTVWLSRFRDGNAESFVFPFHHVAIAGNDRIPHIYGVNADRPMSYSSYRTAFDTARTKAGVNIRFYDARHTFVTRLAENPAVSEETIRQLAGHVSPRMLARYAHIRAQARRDAIAALEPHLPADHSGPRSGSPQKSPQSSANFSTGLARNDKKALKLVDGRFSPVLLCITSYACSHCARKGSPYFEKDDCCHPVISNVTEGPHKIPHSRIPTSRPAKSVMRNGSRERS